MALVKTVAIRSLTTRPGDGTLPALGLEFIGRLDLWDQTYSWISAAEDLEYELANS